MLTKRPTVCNTATKVGHRKQQTLQCSNCSIKTILLNSLYRRNSGYRYEYFISWKLCKKKHKL